MISPEPQRDADRQEPLVDALGPHAPAEPVQRRGDMRSALVIAVLVVVAVSVLVLIL
jgi:hypothetical protein